MDKLLIAILGFSFISGAGLTSAILLTLLFTGCVKIDCQTLFGISSLLTYYFYGILGLIYITLFSMAMIASGIMYWYEMSIDDMKKNALILNEQIDKEHNLDGFDKKLLYLNNCKKESIETFYKKTGLTEQHLTTIKSGYSDLSRRFNKLCDITYNYMYMFRNSTNDIAGLKILYSIYDLICEYKENIETVRSLHNLSRNMQNTMSNLETQKFMTSDSYNPDNPLSMPQGMEAMMENMMKNINLDDFAKMMGGFDLAPLGKKKNN